MEPITTGSTTERIIRTTLVTLLAIGAALWCAYDGFVGYPLGNLERALKDLTPQREASAELISSAVNERAVAALKGKIFLKDVVAELGEPGWQGEGPSGGREARYFGRTGQIIISFGPAERITRVHYEPARYKTETDLAFQKGMGLVIGVIAIILIVHWFRVIIVRTSMTEEGVKRGSGPRVAFDAMKNLRAERYAKKGWLDIEYELDGREGVLRLDDYKIKAFPRIIAEICRRKGWENPHEKWQEQKRARAAGAG
jgi:hypothetical protein